ncbi:carbohydrate-binding protein [Robertkochia solimangrovi]|nr:carbohydrate-binding protein [Robertkochia solimangrovi]
MGVETANLRIHLTDAPGDYDAVYVDIQDVLVNYGAIEEGEEENSGGWQSIGNIEAGVYNLLELTGGISVVLADNEVPAGKISQIRLLLGENNSVEIDGEMMDLDTPSAMQSGLKIKVNETLEPGYTYDFLLDFDVDKSIVVEAGGSGKYNLHPVLYASTIATSGKIQGAITPFDFQVMASVVVGEETISAYTDENGIFVLNGVPAGTYDVLITPDPASGYNETIIEGVIVVNGDLTETDAVTLSMMEGVGAVTGTVTNESFSGEASVMVGTELYTTAIAEDGTFTFYNLPVGVYVITITPEEGSEIEVKEIAEVTVVPGQVLDIGQITLE